MYERGQFVVTRAAPQPPQRSHTQTLDRSYTAPVSSGYNAFPKYSGASSGSSGSLQSKSTSIVSLGRADSRTRLANKEGYAKVKEEGGSILKTFWSERWLVLRETQLEMYKNQTSNKVVSAISVDDITDVTRSDDYPIACQITRTARDGTVKIIILKFDKDDDVYSWMDAINEKSKSSVSQPTSFFHRVHVGFDPVTGGFVGLPPEWDRLLKNSAITKEEWHRNPEAVMTALHFYTKQMKESTTDPTHPSAKGSQSPMPQQSNSNMSLNNRDGAPIAAQRSYEHTMGQNTYASTSGSVQSATPRLDSSASPRLGDRQQFERNANAARYGDGRSPYDDHGYSPASTVSRTPASATQDRGDYGSPYTASPQSISSKTYNAERAAPSAPSPSRDGTNTTTNPIPQGVQRDLVAQRLPPAAPKAAIGSPRAPGSSHGSPHIGGYAKSTMPTDVQYQSKPFAAKSSPKTAQTADMSQKTADAASDDAVKKAELALTAPAPTEAKSTKKSRMSTMTDAQVMEKLRSVVSTDPPLESYNKQKKIGQGASGSVYVARIRPEAPSDIARGLAQKFGPRTQVAIKQMDLRNQPRKELIVNEIVVMKNSRHDNIVNFLDAYLIEDMFELWVVMEFMEGGPLTDVIDNNPSISENQIATICAEVRYVCNFRHGIS